MLRLSPTDIASLYRPSPCDRRVLLRHRGEREAEPSAYDIVLRRLGQQHEEAHLRNYGELIEIAKFPRDERSAVTLDAIAQKVPAIYQPTFIVQICIDGIELTIEGIPDLIVLDDGGYIVRDVKMARRIDQNHHPEILLQLQLYGWLFQQSCGQSPKSLQVWGGTNEITEIPFDGGAAALAELKRLLTVIQSEAPSYEPVGWSKCGGCGFHDKCWKEAETLNDVALILGVDQGLARKLHELGFDSTDKLLANFDAAKLSQLKRKIGKRQQNVGKVATKILQRALAMQNGAEQVLFSPSLPKGPNFVMFDLEGMPPQLHELEKVYLWGMQVFGEKPSPFISAVAGFGENGDRDGWFRFLREARKIFDAYGDLRFVHWAAYESIKLDLYLTRYGDADGTAIRVKKCLFDLLKATQESMVLPLPSFSLKEVEKHVGFKRTQTDFGGQWSMATFIEATETNDERKRRDLMGDILKYNEEDLAATWAVFQWLNSKVKQGSTPR